MVELLSHSNYTHIMVVMGARDPYLTGELARSLQHHL